MDADLGALPNDIDALKAALMIERAKMREVTAERDVRAAELAVARAKASEDLALIAHQKLRIAKLERQIYGPRSERSSLLIEQMALQFEEAEASATEDELAAELAVANVNRSRGLPASVPSETPFPNISPASVSSSIRRRLAIAAAASGFARWARMSRRLWNQYPANGR